MQEVEQLVCYTANSQGNAVSLPLLPAHSAQPHVPLGPMGSRVPWKGFSVHSLHHHCVGLRCPCYCLCHADSASLHSLGIHVCAPAGLYQLAENHLLLCYCEFPIVAGCIVATHLHLDGVLLLPWVSAEQVSQSQFEVTSSASLASLLSKQITLKNQHGAEGRVQSRV